METYLATAVIVGLSLLLGGALCSFVPGGRRWDWLAPAVGLSAAILIAWVGIKLPGDGVTAAGLLGVGAVLSAIRLWGRTAWRELAAGAPPALVVAVLSALPFVASDRIGVLGESLNDDLGFHLDFAYALAEGGLLTGRLPENYPIGPHALAGALSEAFGTTAEPMFMGLILAVPILTALTALAALEDVALPARLIAAPMAGTSYAVAGVLVQASFKELVVGSLVLGFAVVVRRVLRGELSPGPALALSALLAAASCTTFSFPALAWFLVGGALAAAVHATLTRGRAGLRDAVRVVGGLAAFVLALTIVLQVLGAFKSGPLRYTFSQGKQAVVGNLAEHLSPFQALAVWPSDDIRLEPDGDWWRLGVALAVVAVLTGVVRAAQRRDVGLVSVTVAAAAIYGFAVLLTNPYNSAKALAIAGPVLVATALAGLLAPGGGRGWRGLAPIVLAVAWGILALHSSGTLLRAALVRPDDGQSIELRRFADTVVSEPVAFQGQDAFARWELRRADFVFTGGTVDLSGPPGAPRAGLIPATVEWVVSPRTLHAPSPGPELRLVRRTRWYELFRRAEPNRSLAVARQGTAPGAILSCRAKQTRPLLRRGWLAMVKPQPVLGPGGSWVDPTTTRRPFSNEAFTLLGLERTLRQDLVLPPGRWELSLRYYSRDPLTFAAGPLRTTLPAYLADRTRFWRVGSVTSAGRPISVSVTGGESRPIQPRRFAELFDVAAVREDRPGRLVPLRRACGRYVDFVTPPRR